jgi:hypothetical protein
MTSYLKSALIPLMNASPGRFGPMAGTSTCVNAIHEYLGLPSDEIGMPTWLRRRAAMWRHNRTVTTAATAVRGWIDFNVASQKEDDIGSVEVILCWD